MYMFNMNRLYNRPIVAPVVVLIQIKYVYFSVSYQWAIYQKYDRWGHTSPRRYGPLGIIKTLDSPYQSFMT